MSVRWRRNSVAKQGTLAVAVLVGLAVLCPKAAMADSILFTTFGPGNSYDTGHQYGVGVGVFQAFQFTPLTSAVLGSIIVALAGTSPATEFDLYTGTSTALGSLVETFVVPNPTSPSIVTFNSVIKPTLTA